MGSRKVKRRNMETSPQKNCCRSREMIAVQCKMTVVKIEKYDLMKERWS